MTPSMLERSEPQSSAATWVTAPGEGRPTTSTQGVRRAPAARLRRTGRGSSQPFFVVLTAILALALTGGYVLGSAMVTTGGQSTGVGLKSFGSALTYWVQTSTGASKVPGTLPSAVSTLASSPTILPSTSTSYVVTPTAISGDNAVVWVFTESTSALVSKEVKITFSVTVGATTSVYTGYVQTQATGPTSPLTFTFYADKGTGVLVLKSWYQLSQVCGPGNLCP